MVRTLDFCPGGPGFEFCQECKIFTNYASSFSHKFYIRKMHHHNASFYFTYADIHPEFAKSGETVDKAGFILEPPHQKTNNLQ